MSRTTWILVGTGTFLAAVAVGVVASQRSNAVSDHATSAQAQLDRGRRALESNAFVAAVRVARMIDETGPEAAEARTIEGVGLWRLHRWEAAESAWHRALELDPQTPQAAWQLLNIYFFQQRWREAETLALTMYPIEPNLGDRTLLLLELVRQDNERLSPEASALELEPVLVVEPDNAHVSRALGMSYIQLRRFREGAALIARAIDQMPDDIECQYANIWYLFETGQLGRLADALNRLPESTRDDARFLRHRGMWAEATNDVDEAERAYRAALALDSADRKAHYQLARLLRARGAESEAAEHEAESRRLDEAREALAACYQTAFQLKEDLSAELCRDFSRWCRALGRARQASCWDEEANRRPASRG